MMPFLTVHCLYKLLLGCAKQLPLAHSPKTCHSCLVMVFNI